MWGKIGEDAAEMVYMRGAEKRNEIWLMRFDADEVLSDVFRTA